MTADDGAIAHATLLGNRTGDITDARIVPLGLALRGRLAVGACLAELETRVRDLGIPFEGTPGPFNAITDVKGIEVGSTTLIAGDGKLVVGRGPVRRRGHLAPGKHARLGASPRRAAILGEAHPPAARPSS
jgi:hypothetical protein